MVKEKLDWVKFFLKEYFPHDFMTRIDVDSLTEEEVALCYTSNKRNRYSNVPDKKRVYIKYYETEHSYYFLMDVKCRFYDFYDQIIRDKKSREYCKENFQKDNGGQKAAHDEYHIKVSKNDSFIRLQSWCHEINLNGDHREVRNLHYSGKWNGRIRYDVDKKHTLLKWSMRRRNKRRVYIHQYLSLKNIEVAEFNRKILKKCLIQNDPTGIIKQLEEKDLLYVISDSIPNKMRRKADSLLDLLLLKHKYMSIPKRLIDKGFVISDLIMSLVDEKDITKVMIFMKEMETKLNAMAMLAVDTFTAEELCDYGFVEPRTLNNIKRNGLIAELESEDESETLRRHIQRYIVREKLFKSSNDKFLDDYRKYHFFVRYYKRYCKRKKEEVFDEHIVKDYVSMCDQLGEKLNLKIKSYSRLKDEHDRLSIASTIKDIGGEIKIDKRYKDLKLVSTEKYDIELIDSVEKLMLEGSVMKHCVSSYAHNINNGQCAIYNVRVKDSRHSDGWTLEVNSYEKGKYRIVQFRGFRNANAPIEVYADLFKMVTGEEYERNELHASPRPVPAGIQPVEEEEDGFFMELDNIEVEAELPF